MIMMKYIVTTGDEIFLFPSKIKHDDMMRAIHVMSPFVAICTPISAGFVNEEFECFGRSETLNLDARTVEDTRLLLASVRMI